MASSHVSDESSENLVDFCIESDNKNNNNNRTVKTIVRTSTSSVESKSNNNLGASSLVQIWEARLNRSNGGNSPNIVQSTATSSRSDSEVSVQDYYSSESPFIDGDSELADENADRTVEIESGSHFDSGESKWGRVADLVRRLSNEEKNLNAGNNSGSCGGGGLMVIRTPRPCTSMFSSEKTSFPVVNFSPMIRGRQAFTDLLMKMERDRHRELDLLLERNAVSRFAQRGRLLSMLRLRNLDRCLAIQDRSNAKTADKTRFNHIEPSSTVLHLREKFSANAAAAADETKRKDHYRSTEMKNKAVEGTTENTWLKEGGLTLEAFFMEGLNIRDRKIEEATLCKEGETVNGIVESEPSYLHMQETREEEESNDGESEKKEEEKMSQSTCITQESWLSQDQSDSKMENCMHENNEIDQCLEQQETTYLYEWEEQEEYEDEQSYYGEMNNDWLSEISRPRSYWEEQRKSRYLELMNTQREDIRRLLERGTVSDFLESGLREEIDNLLMSRMQAHSNKHSGKWELQQEEKEEEKSEIKEEEEESLTEGEDDQDYRDDSSRSSSSHMFASPPAVSWSSQDTEDTSSPASSAHNPHSPHMEMISSMRSQIQKLKEEMSLQRDSIKTCLDANARLEPSAHRENTLKRKCCACNETQVEAVLYKCGHMCMCLKCANELHWNGGKCPICRAQIVDVVRVFFDTRN